MLEKMENLNFKVFFWAFHILLGVLEARTNDSADLHVRGGGGSHARATEVTTIAPSVQMPEKLESANLVPGLRHSAAEWVSA